VVDLIEQPRQNYLDIWSVLSLQPGFTTSSSAVVRTFHALLSFCVTFTHHLWEVSGMETCCAASIDDEDI
jgi:hypothetical protein